MKNLDIDDIAQKLAKNLSGSLNPRFIKIKKLLVDGKPVTPDRVSRALDIPLDSVQETLGKISNIELDDDGNVVGTGITLNPTVHNFHINNHDLYTWCAFDTLFFPVILEMTAEVKSECPVTGSDITLTVTPERIENLQPEDAAISIVIPEAADACCSVRSAFCNEIYFFKSLETAGEWVKDKKDIYIMTVEEGYQLGRKFTGYLLDNS